MKNPLFDRPATPAFKQIRPNHFLPALDAALKEVENRVERIRRAPASFQNTVMPLDQLFSDANYVARILGNFTSNAYTKQLGKIEKEARLRMAAASKNVFQDKTLGKLFRTVYQARSKLKLDADDEAILRRLHRAFESNGALLDAAGQKKIRKLDEQLIALGQQFRENGQAAPRQNAVHVTDKAELAGISPEQVAGFAAAAKQAKKKGWLVIPERLMVDELLERAESAIFRRRLHEALNRFGTKAPHDNRPVIRKMQKLRHEFARLLGYPDYATFARSRMMKSQLDDVNKFLSTVGTKALKKFETDMRALEIFSARNGGPLRLAPWDVSYWAVRQREALYNFDATGFAKYLELGQVLKGLFAEAGFLFGLTFKPTAKYQKLHPDIETYDVFDRDGSLTGILHIDSFARPGAKSGGAWMNQIQAKSPGHPNVVIFNMNIAKPPKGKPALVALTQYITFYHEMGHALHGLLGTNVKHRSLQGTSAPMDYVEFHSMVNERRGLLKKNLQAYALHVDTGKPAPAALIDALIGSKAHFAPRDMLKLVQNSLRDLAFHGMDPKKYPGEIALEKSVALKSRYVDHIRPYPLTRFGHLFDAAHTGYAAGYVNYLIAEEHAADGFAPFENAPYDKTWAKRLNDLYRRGGGGDHATLYRDYRGRDATPEALLREAGIR